ncbi:MAG TPA: hypothetical protein PL151_07085 [Phycisphaerae bacterium]|nr:hypothetical protein [Phycisphaerae bacterium]HOJ74108.1 hypothetical protein [Phycisphaerae bacterium]HOM50702.1 hypothetical protein [Phycisphaerae bacterium]HON66551.1 hypothetical protein [Phycisphaerae bacterium]HOQ86813.1 hypothetical protein [Phycisphaerae bacterium]
MRSVARAAFVCAAVFALLAGAPVLAQNPAAAPMATAADDEVVVVEAEGEGLDKDQAIKAALREALEKGGKVEIFSQSQVENFQLIHDTIISRAEGIVTDYQIVKGPTPVVGGGTVKVWIKARVSKKAMVDSWGAIQNVLNQIGRPKIMVHIVEKIDGNTEAQSILETKIEERMLKSGFDLVDRNQVQAIAEKEKADAAVQDNLARLQAIAKDFGAHILITGTANANQAGMENLYGTPVAFYNCDAQVKVFWTDTGKLLASVGLPQTRGGARGRKEFSPQAGKQALDIAGQRVVNEIYQQVLSQWSTALSAGGELILEVEGLKAPAAIRLRKMLSEIEGVEKVNYDMTGGLVRFRINARMGGQDLFERLAEGEFEKAIELLDLKPNRIQAKAVEAK